MFDRVHRVVSRASYLDWQIDDFLSGEVDEIDTYFFVQDGGS